MGRAKDFPETPPVETEAVTVSWDKALAQTLVPGGMPLSMGRGGTGLSADMALKLRRSRDQQKERRTARGGASRTKLEARVEALEKENAAIKADLATIHQRVERGMVGPVASLVEAGRLTEARQLVGLLAQASPSSVLEVWSQVLAPPDVRAEQQATGSSFAGNAEWLQRNAEAHAGKWVALRDGTLVDEDPSRVALQRRLAHANALEGITFVRL